MQFTIERSYFTSIFPAASLIFSTFASDRPLMLHKALRVVIWIPFTVQIPTDFIFLMSAIFCGQRRGRDREMLTQTTDFYSDGMQSICDLSIHQTACQMLFGCSHHYEDTRSSLCQCKAFFRCAVYSQSRVSVGGQCLGRRTPVRIREKENLHEIVAEQ